MKSWINIYFCFINHAKAFDYVDHNKLWKILKEMGIPDHLTCLLRNLYAGEEATVRTGHGMMDLFKIGKGICQGCILSPWFSNLYAEYIMRNAGLDEAKAGIKIVGRNINNLRYADDTNLMAENKEELKSLLVKVKEEREKAGLKLSIQKTKIMVSGPITSWQINGKTMETVIDFIFLGSKITADGDYSHEIKRHLLLGRKVMTNLDSILKSREITLPTKVHVVKAMVFPVVVYRCELDCKESWMLKNWCFWTVMLKKPLESPLDSKEIQAVNPKGNQSWIFIGRTDAEAETSILWPPDMKNWLIWKDPDAGKDWRQEGTETTEDEKFGWHHWLGGDEQALVVGDGQGSLACCSPWGHKELDTTERLNWIEWLWWCFSVSRHRRMLPLLLSFLPCSGAVVFLSSSLFEGFHSSVVFCSPLAECLCVILVLLPSAWPVTELSHSPCSESLSALSALISPAWSKGCFLQEPEFLGPIQVSMSLNLPSLLVS